MAAGPSQQIGVTHHREDPAVVRLAGFKQIDHSDVAMRETPLYLRRPALSSLAVSDTSTSS